MKVIYLAILILAIVLLSGCIQQEKGSSVITQPPPSSQIDYSHEYPSTTAKAAGFELEKTGSDFVAYYHPDDDNNANKVLAVLEQGGSALYNEYLGFEPKDIPVYLATSVDEYVKIADFPGGKENVRVGDGSAPNGKIYFYKPFDDTRHGKTEGMIIHEGVHATIFQFMGTEKIQYLPGFLNEGMAHYLEYVFKAGSGFDPLDQIYHSDLLINGAKTGNPKLLGLEELAQKCEGYISDDTLNFLCRGQGTYTVWYIKETYGEEVLGKFLMNLKQTQNWQNALNNATGKTTSQLEQEIQDNLKSRVEQRRR